MIAFTFSRSYPLHNLPFNYSGADMMLKFEDPTAYLRPGIETDNFKNSQLIKWSKPIPNPLKRPNMT